MSRKPRRFKEGDRIKRVTTYHYAGDTRHDYKDRECRKGSTGVVLEYYEPDAYDDSKRAREGLVVSVEWDTGNSSAINEECLDFEIEPVTPEEEAAAIASILGQP